MMKLPPKLTSGLIAIGIYLGVLGLVFYYFGYHSRHTPTHYVAHNDKAIAVSLQTSSAQPQPKKATHPSKSKPKSKPKTPSKPRHTKPKPIVTKKPENVAQKPKPKPKKTPKKIKPKSLFSHVKTAQTSKPKSKKPPKKSAKPMPKTTKKSPDKSKVSREALRKQKEHDKGIENRYLAGVQDKLYGWPPQSNFAGARITIGLTIHPNGHFDYVVLTPSTNPDFDRTIRHYLAQLKTIGFDPTPKGKKYAFKVEIVAK